MRRSRQTRAHARRGMVLERRSIYGRTVPDLFRRRRRPDEAGAAPRPARRDRVGGRAPGRPASVSWSRSWGLSQPTVSKHLKTLREFRMVDGARAGGSTASTGWSPPASSRSAEWLGPFVKPAVAAGQPVQEEVEAVADATSAHPLAPKARGAAVRLGATAASLVGPHPQVGLGPPLRRRLDCRGSSAHRVGLFGSVLRSTARRKEFTWVRSSRSAASGWRRREAPQAAAQDAPPAPQQEVAARRRGGASLRHDRGGGPLPGARRAGPQSLALRADARRVQCDSPPALRLRVLREGTVRVDRDRGADGRQQRQIVHRVAVGEAVRPGRSRGRASARSPRRPSPRRGIV